MKKQLNTSVTATFKDGSQKTYKSIEEASENTGLEINSIKARANKPGSGSKSKDGIIFEWADPAVKRSKTAKKSKAKGNAFELEIIHKLRDIGYEGWIISETFYTRPNLNRDGENYVSLAKRDVETLKEAFKDY